MKILLVPSAYLPSVGGVQWNTYELARQLVALGHEVTILTSNWRRWKLPVHETVDGIEVFRTPFYVFRGSWKSFLAFCAAFPVALASTWMCVRGTKPDLVNVHFAGANALYVLLGVMGRRIPIVVTLHGSEVTDGSARAMGYTAVEERVTRRFVAALLERATFVTAVSQFLIRRADEVCPGILLRSRRVYMGGYADQSVPDAVAPGRFVLAVGRLSREKGFDLLVDAFVDVSRQDPSLRLVIVGDGPERAPLTARARDLGLGETVAFVGAVTKAKVRPYYRGCLFLVVPSRWEGAGTVVWEAFLHAKAVIAADVGGLPELVGHETTGLLFPPEDRQELAKAIVRLAGCRELREAYERSALAFAREHADWRRIAREYERIYHDVLRASSSAPGSV